MVDGWLTIFSFLQYCSFFVRFMSHKSCGKSKRIRRGIFIRRIGSLVDYIDSTVNKYQEYLMVEMITKSPANFCAFGKFDNDVIIVDSLMYKEQHRECKQIN